MINWENYPNFSETEFVCPCCGRADIAESLVKKLQIARMIADIPFTINSGLRCDRRNKEVGGKLNSAHLRGLAADISCKSSHNRYKIVKALFAAGFTRVEIRETWIHADIDLELPQEVIFLS